MDKQMRYYHTMGYYQAIRRNEVLINAKTQMNLENIMHCERRQTQKPHIVRFHLYGTSRISKYLQRQRVD